jgi:hypothetical protein
MYSKQLLEDVNQIINPEFISEKKLDQFIIEHLESYENMIVTYGILEEGMLDKVKAFISKTKDYLLKLPKKIKNSVVTKIKRFYPTKSQWSTFAKTFTLAIIAIVFMSNPEMVEAANLSISAIDNAVSNVDIALSGIVEVQTGLKDSNDINLLFTWLAETGGKIVVDSNGVLQDQKIGTILSKMNMLKEHGISISGDESNLILKVAKGKGEMIQTSSINLPKDYVQEIFKVQTSIDAVLEKFRGICENMAKQYGRSGIDTFTQKSLDPKFIQQLFIKEIAN